MQGDDMVSKLPAFRWAFNFRDWHPTKEQFLFCLKCIQPQERQRVMGFVYKKDAKPALIGRLMLRKCVAETLTLPYDSILFNRSANGKPQVDGNANNTAATGEGKFDLNISHQGDYCALASDAFSKVGVDTMKIEFARERGLADFFHTMRRQFSPSEWDYIREPGIGERTQLFRFMRLWTLKESFVKAEGCGITVDLQAISFECPTKSLSMNKVTADSRVTVNGEHLRDWTFEESLLDEDHCAAVAFNEATNDGNVRAANVFQKLSYDELVKGARPLDDDVDEDETWSSYTSKQERPGVK